MGINSCDSIEAKRYICTTNNRGVGLTAEGETISHGFCESNLEKGMLAAGVVIPVWGQKGNIWRAGKSFLANPSWSRFGNSCMNGWQRSWNSIRHFGNYSNLEFLNGKIAKMEKLITKNPQLTQYYSTSLHNMKLAKATLDGGGNLEKGLMDTLHKGYADARLAHNTGIRTGSVKAGLRLKGCAQMTKGVKTAMAASKWLRGASRTLGKAGGWIAAGLTIVTGALDCFSAWQIGKQTGDQWSCLGKQLLKSTGRAVCELGGAWAGATAGAAIGQACLPFLPGLGAAIGGIIGGFVGWFAGSKTADAIPGLEKSVAQEAMEKAADERKQSLCQAIDAMNQADSIQNFDEASIQAYVGNLQKVFEYVSTYKAPKVQMDANGQPILDAEGQTQPILDANGNMQYEYAQVSEDPTEQQAFQAEIDKLHTWVEEKMAGLQEMEQKMQQAEAERQAELAKYANIGYGCGVLSPEYQADYAGYGAGSGYTYGVGATGYETGSGYGVGVDYASQANSTNYGWANNYSNLAYNYDNGRYDFGNMYNPFMVNYNSNIFATQYGPQAA